MSASRPILSGLNPEQRAAAAYTDGPLLVLAGAGSGKTRVITCKIAYLVAERGVDAAHIAALTFTNKAAREMKARAAALLPGKRGAALNVSTFHTLGLRILRSEHARLGYRRGFTLFDAEDSRQLVRDILKEANEDRAEAIDVMQMRVSDYKSCLLTSEEAAAKADDALALRAAQVYAAYQRYLRAYNAVDFDDLIARPVQLFRDEPTVLEVWQNRLRYLLVDEYQDTNGAQYELLKMLAGAHAALTAVGDDDQSVYSWRGARPDNLLYLQQDFPSLKVIKLEQNYRCAPRILRAANALIGNNPHLFAKRLWSELKECAPIRVLACADERDEAERVVTEIADRKLLKRCEYGDCAVLYRGNHQARAMERALRERQIPYAVSGGTSFFDRGEVRDVLAYLRLIANPDDDAAFLRIVNLPRREIGATTLEKLGHYAGERHCSLFSACFGADLDTILAPRQQAGLRQFAKFIGQLGESDATPAAIARQVVQGVGYADWLRDSCRDAKAAERRMENVNELLGWLDNLVKQDPERDLAATMNHLSLMDRLDKTETEKDNRVQLMTLHAAKGLEFDCVFLIGFEEELLPHRENLEGPGVEEERRLAYVGITRARRALYLSYAARRRRYGEEAACTPSRFLTELPAAELDLPGNGKPADPVRRDEQRRTHLAALRGLLDEAG
ncbi:MAG TPA: UvrD-helicase domain-containing protein [Gammaproteobacteria bacterium]|nr:UvrD-helicase domain-containing protein [Gammaproteobacteria bacterium]